MLNKYLLAFFLYVLLHQACLANEVESRYETCSLQSCRMLPPILSAHETLDDQAIVFETSPQSFMERSTKNFSSQNNGGWQTIQIYENKYTNNIPVIGFGGSFTDSATVLYKNLHIDLQKQLINLYFSFQGIAYSLGRVPIASADFSCRSDKRPEPSLGSCSSEFSTYTYRDKPTDVFSLQSEDLNYKIPMILDAMASTEKNNSSLSLLASPWSAPAWMKTNGKMIHGSLLPKFQSAWAQYFVDFLKAYKERQIKFWAITVQNEPEEMGPLGDQFQTWQSMFYTLEEEATFIKNYLGPTIADFAKSYGSKISIIMHDGQITSISDKAAILDDPDIAKYVAGAGLHWYTNSDLFYPFLDAAFNLLNKLEKKPLRFILGTEACEGFQPWGTKGPILGNWARGEAYAHDIISDLNHHVSGWIDWNLMLDTQGGPNWAKNYVDAPILVDVNKQILFIQPMYFYFGHFSRFIRPDSIMLDSKSEGIIPLEEVAFKVPAYNGLPATITIVVLNRDNSGRKYYIKDNSKIGTPFLNLTIPAHSIQTIIYKTYG